ncbi:hypothetical protein H5410_057088 [Solanum commersonii]|uniref:Uncharacterized protein n=1 Tax=Solanum commersonii TaxID=4109 RepID=A0A9J5WN38_SOLCO|nr:hypothetical protein H5410_057088 [Solanum commersonii]
MRKNVSFFVLFYHSYLREQEYDISGKEHSGRVRCLELRIIPSKVFKQVRPCFGGASASSSEASYLSQCQENHNQMMNAHNTQMMNVFKEYMIMKEGMISEQYAGFFAFPSTNSPTTMPTDATSEPILPINTIRSCGGDSNPSQNNR